MKSAEEKGPRADWIARHRLAKYGTNMDAFRAALEATARELGIKGFTAADSTVRGWEAGANARPETWRALAALFEEDPPEPQKPATLDDLVGAISDLVTEMRLARGEQAAALRGVEKALDLAAKLQERAGSESSSEPRFPAGVPR